MLVYRSSYVWIPRPEHLKDEDDLVRLLTMPLARRLAEALGGQRLDIPAPIKHERKLRTARIVRSGAKGSR
jgi:hypothetical protein